MQTAATHPKKAYTVAEAGALLSLSRSLMYELINAGRIQTIQIGRARRITARQLDDFLDRQERIIASGALPRL